MFGFVVVALWFGLGRVIAVPLLMMALAARSFDGPARLGAGITACAAAGLAPAAWLYARDQDPWETMHETAGGPWLDIVDAAMLLVTVVTLVALALRDRRRRQADG